MLDLVGQKVKDAVSLSNFGQFPLPAGVPLNGLKATLSDQTSGLVAARYDFDKASIYAGGNIFCSPIRATPIRRLHRDRQLSCPGGLRERYGLC